jgi:hypothetical protein
MSAVMNLANVASVNLPPLTVLAACAAHARNACTAGSLSYGDSGTLLGFAAGVERDTTAGADEVADALSGSASGSDFDLEEHPVTDTNTSAAAATTRTRTKTSIK